MHNIIDSHLVARLLKLAMKLCSHDAECANWKLPDFKFHFPM